MPNSHFHTAVSQPRFARYLAACTGNTEKALALYRANIALSQQMYGVIGVFEVILRNSINRHYLSRKGNEWLANAVADGGYLDISPDCEDTYHCVQDAIHKLGLKYTHDALIAKLSLGFWTYQFAKNEYAAAGSTLLEIFVNRPFGTKQKDVNKKLFKIKEIRNRIAHYEPICFDRTNNISTDLVKRRYELIIELLEWLGCNPAQLLHEIDKVQEAVNKVEDIKRSLKDFEVKRPSPGITRMPAAYTGRIRLLKDEHNYSIRLHTWNIGATVLKLYSYHG